MIYGNIMQVEALGYLEKKVRDCLIYAKEHDLKAMETGSYELDGKNSFFNLCEYTTTVPEERVWEAHREYLDIHMMVKGREQMDVSFTERMEEKSFEKEKDLLLLEGKADGHIVLQEGDFLVCYPQDAHRTAIQVEEPEEIKKVIFKVKIS